MKVVRNCAPVAKNPTFWNLERVKRGLTYPQIRNYMLKWGIDRASSVYGRIFVGIDMPDTDTISILCRWFSELGDEIPFEVGKAKFHEAYLNHKPEKHRTIVAKCENKIEKEIEVMESRRKGGRTCKSEIGKLIQNNNYTIQGMANKIGVKKYTFKQYVEGKRRVTDDVIIDVTEALNNDPENIERLFNEAYDQYHTNPDQVTVDEIKTSEPIDIPEEKPEPNPVEVVSEEPPKSKRSFNTLLPLYINERDIALFDYIVNVCTCLPSESEGGKTFGLDDIIELLTILSEAKVDYTDILYWAWRRANWGGFTRIALYMGKNQYISTDDII